MTAVQVLLFQPRYYTSIYSILCRENFQQCTLQIRTLEKNA